MKYFTDPKLTLLLNIIDFYLFSSFSYDVVNYIYSNIYKLTEQKIVLISTLKYIKQYFIN